MSNSIQELAGLFNDYCTKHFEKLGLTSSFSEVGTNLSNIGMDQSSPGLPKDAIFASSKSVGSLNSNSPLQNKDLLSDFQRKKGRQSKDIKRNQ